MPFEFLAPYREDTPQWLATFGPEDQFSRKDFLSSRIVLYPGAGTDGQPVAAFNSAHAAHCFVYADYGVSSENLRRELDDPIQGFRGYHSLARIDLRERDLAPDGWVSHVAPNEVRIRVETVVPFGFVEFLERDAAHDDAHGASRLAVLFLGADGFATFDALFCQGNDTPAPFGIVIQDHSFGGNYGHFGDGGLLQSIATRCAVFPEFLLVGDNTKPWAGYTRCEARSRSACTIPIGVYIEKRTLNVEG